LRITENHFPGNANQSVLLILLDYLGIQEVIGWNELWVGRSPRAMLSWRKDGMSVNLEQCLCILVELVRGE